MHPAPEALRVPPLPTAPAAPHSADLAGADDPAPVEDAGGAYPTIDPLEPFESAPEGPNPTVEVVSAAPQLSVTLKGAGLKVLLGKTNLPQPSIHNQYGDINNEAEYTLTIKEAVSTLFRDSVLEVDPKTFTDLCAEYGGAAKEPRQGGIVDPKALAATLQCTPMPDEKRGIFDVKGWLGAIQKNALKKTALSAQRYIDKLLAQGLDTRNVELMLAKLSNPKLAVNSYFAAYFTETFLPKFNSDEQAALKKKIPEPLARLIELNS